MTSTSLMLSLCRLYNPLISSIQHRLANEIPLDKLPLLSPNGTYGRLYNWLTAMKSCPSGWHLPTQAEWNTLSSYVTSNGCSYCSAAYLQVTGFGFGTDDYSFSALPGGIGKLDGSFDYVGNDGYWWTASEDEDNSDRAWRLHMSLSESAFLNSSNKSSLFSVRCLQD
jgi:uncharacterized protein (TIGR02145 family)